MEDLVVSVGADISGFLSKIDAAKAKVGQLTEKQGELQAVIKDLNSSFNLNEKELTKASVSLQKLNTTSAAGKTAAANLRKEIEQLSGDSKTLSSSLSTAKTQLAATTTGLKVATTELKAAEAGGTGFAKGATKAYSALRTLANIIPGIGIGGLVALIAGPIVDAFAAWFSAINDVNSASAQLAVNQANINDVIKEANKDAGKQTADLKILYEAATNVNLSMKDRLTAVKGLQNEFPEFFKNLSKEAILNGSAQTAYEGATKSIIANARATAALSKIRELSGKQLDSEQEKQEILTKMRANDLENAKANLKDGRDAEQRGLDQYNAIWKKGSLQKDLDQNRANAKALEDQILFLEEFATLPELVKAVDVPVPKIKPEKAAKAIKEIALEISKGAKIAKIEIPLDLLPPKASQLNSTIKYSFDTISKKLRAKMDEMRAIVAEGLTTIQTDTLAGLGEALGSAIGGGKDTFKGLFDGIFNSVGDQLQNLGKFLIKSAIEIKLAKDAFKKLLANPIASIAVGIGLIALGALIKQQLKKDAPGFAGGGFINGPGSKTSDSINARLSRGEYVIKADSVSKYGKSFFDMINGGNFSRNNNYANGGMVSGNIGGGQLITVEVVGNIRGNDIFIANKRAGLKIGRNG